MDKYNQYKISFCLIPRIKKIELHKNYGLIIKSKL